MKKYLGLALLCLEPLAAEGLRAGVARADITPAGPERMWGFFNRVKPAEGMHEPLEARVLVLEHGKSRVVLVNTDLGRAFSHPVMARLRQGVSEPDFRTHLVVAATHTHAGPVILDEYPDGAVPKWETEAEARILRAFREARGRLREARIGTGYGRAEAGYNRRAVPAGGGPVKMLWRNEERVPTAPLDPAVPVLRVDSARGEPLAIVVNHALHPVVFGSGNRKYSGDFPAVLIRTVEAAFDKRPVAFFLQGACGDINPYYAGANEDIVGKREWTGVTIGNEAARVAREITTTAANGGIEFVEHEFTFRSRWDLARHREELIQSIGPEAFEQFAAGTKSEYKVPVSLVVLDRRIAMLNVPGEFFVEFQMDWRARCPAPDAFFVGFANGYQGYFPTIKAAAEGGYGAAGTTTWVEAGAGEKVVDFAVIRLYELQGRLKRIPAR